jgi:hypothetical protein
VPIWKYGAKPASKGGRPGKEVSAMSTQRFQQEVIEQATAHLEAGVRQLERRILRRGGQPVTEAAVAILYPHASALERLWLYAELLYAQAF